ncbi:MAG: membrane protein insertase YidC [Pseudomonadota bacterium]
MDNSRLFLYAGLLFVGMLIYQQWQVDYGPQPVAPAAETTVSENEASRSEFIVADDLPDQADEITASDTTGSSSSTSSAEADVPQAQLIRIDTDVIQAWIDTRGGIIRSVRLKKYPTSLEEPDNWLDLVHSEVKSSHILQSGLINKSSWAPTHHSIYRVDQNIFELEEGADELIVPLYWSQDGLEVVKQYRFTRGDYLASVEHLVSNQSDQDWQGSQYRQLQRTRPLDESRLLYTYTGGVYYNEEIKYEKYDFDDMEDEALNLQSTGGWIAMIQHYFMSAWVPDQNEKNLVYSIANTKKSPATYTIGLRSSNQIISAGDQGEFKSLFYVGPKLVKRLEEIAPGLDLTVDYGVLTFLSKPLYWLLAWYHGFVGNWGLAIILLTFTIKAVFYKLSETSYRSMAKMRKVSPRLKTLKERFGDDRQKMNQAMMELYKSEKINPMGGCLPILVQIPVFIALYWALLESVDLRQAPFFLWIQDLSVRDPFFVLPIIMGVSMVIQKR